MNTVKNAGSALFSALSVFWGSKGTDVVRGWGRGRRVTLDPADSWPVIEKALGPETAHKARPGVRVAGPGTRDPAQAKRGDKVEGFLKIRRVRIHPSPLAQTLKGHSHRTLKLVPFTCLLCL